MTPSGPQLSVNNLCCIRGERRLFEGLVFTLSPRQVLLVEGSNGSGKTTLLRVLSGIRLPDEGEVCWNAEPIEGLKGDYLEQLAYVGHLDGIKRDLTAWENLAFALAMGKGNDQAIAAVLDEVGLAGYEDIPAAQFSAGQRRRLALARLLLIKARLWILDEPVTSLDRAGVAWFQSLVVRHVQQGGMVVMSAHQDMDFGDIAVQRINLSA